MRRVADSGLRGVLVGILLGVTTACGGGGGSGASTTWVQAAGGSYSDRGYAVAGFEDGSFAMTGHARGPAIFGEGDAAVSVGEIAEQAAPVVRYGVDGSILWVRWIPGAQGRGIASLADGGLLIAGRFEGEAVFGTGASQVVLTSRGGWDAFLARYEGDGTFTWVRQAGGAQDDAAQSVAAFADGSCALVGSMGGTATFGAAGAAVDLVASHATSLFVARYTPSGNLAWAQSPSGEIFDEHLAVAASADGSCILTGSFYVEITFGEGPGAESLTAVDLNAFLVRLDGSGDVVWARQVHGDFPNNTEGTGVAALSDGSSIVCGRFYGTCTFGEDAEEITLESHGTSDAYVARYDASGSPVWARHAGGERDDRAYAVAAFPDGSCVITGRFEEAATFGEAPDGVELLAYGTWDAFVARYAGDGSFLWAQGGGGGRHTAGYGIATSTGGACVVTGSFPESATFGVAPSVEVLVGLGGEEIFVGRLGPTGGL